jgi:4-hydroxybenzoyl-CoA thioesterase
VFQYQQKVLFQHCDPAGIVFYPRYYEMLNACVETWFDTQLNYSFTYMHGPAGGGVPTVRHSADFHAPSRHGDDLGFGLRIIRVGKSSIDLVIKVTCAGQLRVHFETRLVFIHQDSGRSEPWPADLRQKLVHILGENT